jgi:hypothetical protein
MANNKPALTARKASARSRVSNGKDLLPGVDGRSPLARRYRDICAALISDMGGIDRCTEARLQLLRRFSAASVMAEAMEAELVNGKQISIVEHSLLSSTLVRLAQRIGISRMPKNVTPYLHDYLEQAAASSSEDTSDEVSSSDEEEEAA